MAFTVFYAWQDDRPNNICRGFIRRALDKAAAKLNARLLIEEPDRRVEIDQDTQGVPGSPPVAQTILDKIAACDAFVADLTFIPTGKGFRQTPNPNVLIEYGYALRALSEQRIIAVFNEAFGDPEDLPFDLAHKRWPIRYRAADESGSEAAQALRKNARDGLSSGLESAIGAIIQTFAESEKSVEFVGPSEPAEPPERPAVIEPIISTEEATAAPPPRPAAVWEYPWNDSLVGMREDRKPGAAGYAVHLLEGPSIHLGLTSKATGQWLSNAEVYRIARESLRPMASYRSTGWTCVRNLNGAAVFTWLAADPDTAVTASQLLRNRDLHGIDRYHLQVWRMKGETDDPYIPTGAVEEIVTDTLADFLDLAQHRLSLSPPLEVFAGLDGINGYRLAVDPAHFMEQKVVGRIHYAHVGHSATIESYECDPYDVLLPFFNEIYDFAGVERPNVRTVGKRPR